MSVVFLERWGKKSYKVVYGGLYNNDRIPHVETPEQNLEGRTFPLGARRVLNLGPGGERVAITYDVVGVTNGNHPAHITVFVGPLNQAHVY